MSDDASNGASSSTVKAGDDSESTIEINIKTLDSQVHKLSVQKNASVLALKEKIVEAAGIPVDQQRLIFRGRVLKDDHLLSEYHLEDGYTLHLVARRAAAEGQHSSGAPDENAHANVNVAGNGGLLGDISREIIEAMHSEGMIDDLARSVRDILGSIGLAMPGGMTNATFSVPLGTAPEGANNINVRTQPGNHAQPGFSILNHQIQVSQLQPAGSIPRNMVIPDSLTTLLEYINRMDQVLQNNGTPSVDSNTEQPPRSDDAYLSQRFPSPEVLVSVIERAQQLLGGSASSSLSHLAQRIQRDASTGDTSIRSQIQNESAQLGVAMQHLGAMLLELGRTMMMLRMGPSPADAFVNAGSSVYINSAGPNPIMVQPSFQNTPPFGLSSIPVLGGISGTFGIVDPSRSSGVNTHGNSTTSGSSAGMATASVGTVNDGRQNVERTQGGNPSANSMHGVPTRTVIAAIPARPTVEAPNHVLSVILPVQVRSQVAVPNQSNLSQGSHTAVGSGSQPNATDTIPQASVGGVASVPSIVAQINAQIANALSVNQQSQVSSSEQNTTVQGSRPITTNGADNAQSVASAITQLQTELSDINGGRTSLNAQSYDIPPSNTSDRNSSSEGSRTKHAEMEGIHADNVGKPSGESASANLAGQIAATCTDDSSVNRSSVNSPQKNMPLDGVSSQSIIPSTSSRSEPVGLGGGLQPKRRSRTSKPPGSSSDAGEALNSSRVSNSQDAVSMGQQVLQALASQNSNVNRSSIADSPPPSITSQFSGGMPPRRQGGEGQVDFGSMISNVLNNPVFGNLLSNVAEQAGMGSAGDLRNMVEECAQSPAMMDTMSNIVQNVDGSGRGIGGLDLSRMMQQMMPVVSQVLGGAGAHSAGTNSGQSRLQPQHIDMRVDDASDYGSSQIDLHQACQHIEQHNSPRDIFSAVLETASQAYGEDESIEDMLEELVSDPELTDDYLKLLLQQVRQRIQSASQTRNQS
ncbi:ubiquitin-like domain-containing protein CIP73 isoform X1 [Oryza brachyantha]|nr:ubiquitin-like domain-containing protein CIP73 isoform X1 [Oryza brachyantha]